jgi:hypothetical protein
MVAASHGEAKAQAASAARGPGGGSFVRPVLLRFARCLRRAGVRVRVVGGPGGRASLDAKQALDSAPVQAAWRRCRGRVALGGAFAGREGARRRPGG